MEETKKFEGVDKFFKNMMGGNGGGAGGDYDDEGEKESKIMMT